MKCNSYVPDFYTLEPKGLGGPGCMHLFHKFFNPHNLTPTPFTFLNSGHPLLNNEVGTFSRSILLLQLGHATATFWHFPKWSWNSKTVKWKNVNWVNIISFYIVCPFREAKLLKQQFTIKKKRATSDLVFSFANLIHVLSFILLSFLKWLISRHFL